jgi:hypothetical protein
VNEVETPDTAAMRDRARAEAELSELRPRDHAMLPRRQFGQRDVGAGMAETSAAGVLSLLRAQFVTNSASVWTPWCHRTRERRRLGDLRAATRQT